MDDKGDLIAFARESATSGVDLYELLGVDTTTSREDIHRAWRRQGLKYHPDKAGANFDASLYERFSRARDVLVDEAAREVYDAGRAAAAQRKMQSEQMTAERRRFKDELEAAERATREGGSGGGMGGDAPFAYKASSGPTVLSSEREKLREAGRRRAEERLRQEQEAQDRQRQREDERIAELEQLLREKQERAQRRAEKKAARSGSATEATSATATAKKGAEETADQSTTTTTSQPDPEWRKLLSSGRAQAAKTTEGGVDVTQRPIFAYTMERLRAAGEAQRQRQAKAAGVGITPAFEPQWQEIDDPAVRKFIKRVPRF